MERECPHPKARVWRRIEEIYGVGTMIITIWVCDRCADSWEIKKYVPPQEETD